MENKNLGGDGLLIPWEKGQSKLKDENYGILTFFMKKKCNLHGKELNSLELFYVENKKGWKLGF